MNKPLLAVEDLSVVYQARSGPVAALQDITFDMRQGEVLGVVGQSGSGKSTLSAALLRLLPPNGRICSGSMRLDGRDLLALGDEELRALRGGELAMIFQDPMTSMNPTFTVASQMVAVQRAHSSEDAEDRDDAKRFRERAVEMLDRVGIREARSRIDNYPYEFSGGMRQRIMIAMALLLQPKLLVADEATSALDVTLQAQILDLLCDLCQEQDTGVLMISHDIGVIAEVCENVVVLKDGRMVEQGDVDRVLSAPSHAYTKKLLGAVPSRHRRHEQLGGNGKGRREAVGRDVQRDSDTLLVLEDVQAHFYGRRSLVQKVLRRPPSVVRAVDGVDLTLQRGEAVGLVGESGSGKTTLGKAGIALAPATAGRIFYEGQDLRTIDRREWRRLRRKVQMIFQEPHASLSPRLRVSQLLTEPYRIHGVAEDERYTVPQLLDMVLLGPEQADKYPHELSGGQARRVGIARALAMHPEFIVADEPSAGLDVLAAASVLDLLQDLRKRLGLTYLIITHDLNLVGYIADRIAVMQQGKLVEVGTTDRVFDAPEHPYTRELLAAAPDPTERMSK